MKIDADMSFRKLEIFIAFMACGNIARAAEQLSLSNVSVHRALHTLEENIRCPLFIHQGRNLKPLPAARCAYAAGIRAGRGGCHGERDYRSAQ